MRNRFSFLPVVAGAIAVAGLGLGLVACSDDDDSSEEDVAAVQASIDAINKATLDGDTSTIDQHLTEDGASNIFGGSSIEEIKNDPSIIAVPSEDEFFVAEEITVDGDTAEALGGFPNSEDAGAPLTSGGTIVYFVKDGDFWKADSLGVKDAEEPDGANTVEVSLNEFEFVWDDADFKAGAPIFFKLSNDGEQTHEFIMVRLPEEGDFIEMLTSEEDIPGFEFLGFVGTFAAGDESTAAYTLALEPGRYGFACFLPDTSKANPEDQQPHALLGMAREITVQ